jgi:two-component system cell cycle response regulator
VVRVSDLGTLLLSVVRSVDLAVRFGGEEFVLLLNNVGTLEADAILIRIRDTWKATHPAITFSAGIAILDESLDATASLAAADRSLYLVKESGRNRWLFAGNHATG